MSDTIQTLDLVTLAQAYRGDTVRQINRRVALLKMLEIRPGEGKNVAWAPEADGALAENFADGADAANFCSDAQASAVLSWGLYRANFHLSKLAMDAAKTSQTPEGNRLLWARNLVNNSAKLASFINKDCFSGAGTGTLIEGLDHAVATSGNTYAGIARSTGYFNPTVVEPGSDTAVSFALIRDDIRKIYEACGENPDLAMCSPTLFNSIGGLFDQTRRQIDQVMVAKGPVRLDFGWQALEVDGTIFVKDKDATAKTVYYLNTNHVHVEYLPSANMSALPQMEIQADDGFGPVPLGMDYEMLAKTGPSEKAEIVSTIQLCVDRPNSCGARLHAV
jgi:hypothetical protein